MASSRLVEALHCRNNSRPPVWLMRQAGRYMPEYRALRSRYSFLEMCHTPDLITEVTLQPVRAFDVDAAILFSDILIIPEALGLGLHVEDGVGPRFERPLESADEAASLPRLEIKEALSYVAAGIKQLKKVLKVPLIGFCGAPFTLASYMIEGKTSRDLRKTKQWMLSDPVSFHLLLQLLADYAISYLEMQAEAGVDAVQVFDSWAGMLGHAQFCEFSLAYLKKIVSRIKSKVPVILFCRGSSVFAPEMAAAKPHAISLDWQANIAGMRKQIRSPIALQGNLDPDILLAPLPIIRQEVKRMLASMQGDPGYIFNLGHGVMPEVPVAAVRELVECVKK